MKKFFKRVLVIGVLLTALYLSFNYGRHHPAGSAETGASKDETSSDSGEASKKATAHVETAHVRRGEIAREIKTYGSVSAQTDKIQTISLAFECRVARLLVSSGEPVTKGSPIVEIEPSPETELLLEESKHAEEAATKEVRQARQRFQAKLATNQELGAAEQAALSAENKLQSLLKRGVEPRRTLTADTDGLIGEVKVQNGQIVAAGAPLMDVIAGSQIEVKLGVETNEAPHLAEGQPVRLSTVNDPTAPAVEGKIRLVTQRVNPELRTVDVYVSLPDDSHLMLNQYVSALIAVKSAKDALLVPRAAVLPDGDAWSLYIVKDGHAVKKDVQIGIETDAEVEISGTDVHEADEVVVTGNYELADGMSVETK